MKIQTFKNHTQHDIFLYVLTGLAIVLGILLGVVTKKIDLVVPLHGLQYIIPVLITVFLILLMAKMRKYATTLQDRIIRQEVQFRYFASTGKTLPESITLAYMIGLRFSGDSEFIALINKINANPSLTTKEIKTQIKNWKGDYNRV